MIKRRKAIKIYMKLMTKSPVLFLSYLAIFITVSLYLMITTRISAVNTYSALAEIINEKPYILFDTGPFINSDKIYIYTDKNKAVYETQVQIASNDSEKNLYEVSYNNDIISDFFIKNNGKEVKVDIPYGETTLLRKIFLKGGKL